MSKLLARSRPLAKKLERGRRELWWCSRIQRCRSIYWLLLSISRRGPFVWIGWASRSGMAKRRWGFVERGILLANKYGVHALRTKRIILSYVLFIRILLDMIYSLIFFKFNFINLTLLDDICQILFHLWPHRISICIICQQLMLTVFLRFRTLTIIHTIRYVCLPIFQRQSSLRVF